MSMTHEGDLHKTPYSHWSISGYPMPEDTPYATREISADVTVSDVVLVDIAKAVNGEFHAIRRYSRMMELTSNPSIQAILREIRRDEKKHFHRFASIYSAWTGGKQVALRKNQVPSSFEAGVKESIQAEQKDVEFYRRIAEQTRVPYIQRSFLDASYDERRHANWFIYLENLLYSRGDE